MIKLIKKKWKLILGLTVVGAVVFILIVSLLLGNIIKTAAETIGPKATGTELKLDSVYFNVFSGNVSISGAVIKNPKGYDTQNAFELGHFNVSISLASLISDKLVVENIEIHNMKVTYEQALTTNNISEIKANVDKFGGKIENTNESEVGEKPKGESTKLQVDNILIEDTQVSLSAKGLGAEATVTVPKIHIKNLGTEGEGITLEELLVTLMNAIAEGITTAATSIDTDGTVDALKEGSGKLIDKVKGLF
jgi:hypothetical protein